MLLPLKLYSISIAFFHSSEFFLACVFMKEELSSRSLLVSKPYCVAMGLSLLEFYLECKLASWKYQVFHYSIYVGMAAVLLGEIMRKAAMLTAKSNFTHDIRRNRDDQHSLVVTGIYRYIRHPGYLGWYIWVVGTQLLLANPICIILFVVLVWSFFKERIEYEERLLVQFFGEAYKQYAAATPTWIPYVK